MEQKISKDKTVLVVEDERPLAEAIRMKLEGAGFDVVVARTGEQAFDYLNELKQIDAVWLDHYLLGKANGLDVVVKLKSKESPWRHIPVFVVSNTASQDKVQSYVQMGVDKYYVKAQYRLADIIADVERSMKTSREAALS
jgi:two-component system response regulator VicR